MINYNNSNNLSPARTGLSSSSESDLDVDSALDEATPENLSLKKEESVSPSHTSSTADIIRHFGTNNNSQGLIPYYHPNFLVSAAASTNSHIINNSHQHHMHSHIQSHHHQQSEILCSSHVFNTESSVGGLQRSPVDVLMRVFPNHRRNDVEQLLQRYKGDILQTMEFILSGENISQIHVQTSSNNAVPALPQASTFSLKSAFSPLVTPISVFNSTTHRYPAFIQEHTKRFMSPPFLSLIHI